jgi:hypothetical protein
MESQAQNAEAGCVSGNWLQCSGVSGKMKTACGWSGGWWVTRRANDESPETVYHICFPGASERKVKK